MLKGFQFTVRLRSEESRKLLRSFQEERKNVNKNYLRARSDSVRDQNVEIFNLKYKYFRRDANHCEILSATLFCSMASEREMFGRNWLIKHKKFYDFVERAPSGKLHSVVVLAEKGLGNVI